MSSNSEYFSAVEEVEEELNTESFNDLKNMKKSKYKIVNIGYTLDSLNPKSTKRNIFMIEISGETFPTLIVDKKKKKFPFYVSSGTNFSDSQKDKLTCYAGHTLIHPNHLINFIKSIYKEGTIKYYRKKSGVTDITKDLFSFFLNYCQKYKKNEENEEITIDIDNFIHKIAILGNWFIKFIPSIKINGDYNIYKTNSYDEKYTNYINESGEDIFTFLGGKKFKEGCTLTKVPTEYKCNRTKLESGQGKITEALQRTTSGQGQSDTEIKKLEELYIERYCGNKKLYKLRNAHKGIKELNKHLSKFEVNSWIGDNNIYDRDLTDINPNEEDDIISKSILTGKHTRIINYFIDTFIVNTFMSLNLEKIKEEFLKIIKKSYDKRDILGIGEKDLKEYRYLVIFSGKDFVIEEPTAPREEEIIEEPKPTSPQEKEIIKNIRLMNAFLEKNYLIIHHFILLLHFLYDKITENNKIQKERAEVFNGTHFIDFVCLPLYPLIEKYKVENYTPKVEGLKITMKLTKPKSKSKSKPKPKPKPKSKSKSKSIKKKSIKKKSIKKKSTKPKSIKKKQIKRTNEVVSKRSSKQTQ